METQNKQNIQISQKQPNSIMAITSFVFGLVALLTSFIPIVNNVSFFIALLGIVFGIIGIVGILKHKKSLKTLCIIALIINIVAVIAVLGVQSFLGNALDKAKNGAQVSSISKQENNSQEEAQNNAKSNEAKVGDTITLDNNLELTVVSVEGGFTNYDGSAVTKVSLKYKNNSNKELSYNAYDWKAENSQGAQTSQTIYSNGKLNANQENLQSGTLAPGGTTSGVLYFKGDVKKVLYSSTILSSTTATWIV